MKALHFRHRRRLALLAAGALDGTEREQALAHAASCAECAAEVAELGEVLARLASDPARSAELPVPAAALTARVLAQLDRPPAPREWPGWRWLLAPAMAAAAFLAALGLPGRKPASEPPPAAVSEDALLRLERTVGREQAVRYLNEAGDVLVNVAASLPRCERNRRHLDVYEESRRSRELLARRAFVDLGGDEVASARPVLQDVEQLLREVAALDPCARPGDLAAIQEELSRRRVLMKIDLMTRELQG